MKAKFFSMLLSLAMILSLVAAFTVFVSADSENLQICTDVVDVSGNKYESTAQLPADGWFELTYNDLIVDEDGSVAYYRVRGWANPLDDSDLKQFGYSLESDEIIWDDSFMAPNAGLSSYYAKAQRFDLTVNLAYVPVGEYEFHLYAKTTSGVYEIEEEYFAFEKKAMGKATHTATFKDGDTVVATVQFEEGAKSIEEPAVPAKEGFTGAWEAYTLADQDIEIKAVYTAVPADETTVTEETTVADETTVAEVTTAADVTTVEEITTVASADDTTKADEKKSGCGGMISASLVIVALLGGAFILNKRKD